MLSCFKLLFLLAVSLEAASIEMIGITQYSLTTKGVSYSITSQKRIINPPKKKKSIFEIIGKKRGLVSNSSYYLEGTFKNSRSTINFQKAYWLEGVFYMQDCSGVLPGFSFRAKEVSFYKKKYNFKTIRYKKNNKRYIKHEYTLQLY